MSEEGDIKKLIERIDELLIILNRIIEDLNDVSTALKSFAVSRLPETTSQPEKPTPPPETVEERSIDDVKMMFPEDLENMLNFEEKDDYIMIKPRQFLGSENFAKIASIVRGVGGDYISAGKESHFRIPRRKT